jgi:glycerophosphoryl diester phosphodiesterase
MPARPIVIAHRGASGYLPEHTLAAYFVAVQQGADYIEPDLVMTHDGVLVARHENEIGGTTDVAQRPEYAARRTTKSIDGVEQTGWFTEDFTLAELKTLRARERIPDLRPANTRLDGMFEIPALDEILGLARALDAQRQSAAAQRGEPVPAPIGVYPETKHPSYHTGLGLPIEQALLDALQRHGYQDERAPVFIQCFEVGNLRWLAQRTRLRLIQLFEETGRPWDFTASGDPRTYADLATPAGLAEIASYAAGIGAHKNLIIPRDARDCLAAPTALVADAHAAGLQVHAWTFRAENAFLPAEFRAGGGQAQLGDLHGELSAFVQAGVDGVFADHPDVAARCAMLAGPQR